MNCFGNVVGGGGVEDLAFPLSKLASFDNFWNLRQNNNNAQSRGGHRGGVQCGRRQHLSVSGVGRARTWKKQPKNLPSLLIKCRFSKGIW